MNAANIYKAGAELGRQGTSMPPVFKGIIAVGAMVGIAYVVIKLVKTGKLIKSNAGAREELDNSRTDLDKLAKSGVKPSMSDSQISAAANKLFTAFDGYGTDYVAVGSALSSIKNEADILAIIKAFGIREISSGKLNPEPNLTGTLSQAIVSELSTDQLMQVNKFFASKGIKFRF